MFSQLFMNTMISNLTHTGIAVAIVAIFYFLGVHLIGNHLSEEQNKSRLRARLYYTLLILLALILTKIWVQGFSQILTILSLVSAALVIANKEFIMNVIGWFIINWRSLFSEKDFVQIGAHSGYVYEMGWLYFKLFEGSPVSGQRSSGKMIKVPNGLVIHNPVTNFSFSSNLIEYQQHWIVNYDSNIPLAKELIDSTVKTIVHDYYKGSKLFTAESLKKKNKLLASLIDLKVHVKTTVIQSKPSGVKFSISYYCFPKDYDTLNNLITETLIANIKDTPQITLVFEV